MVNSLVCFYMVRWKLDWQSYHTYCNATLCGTFEISIVLVKNSTRRTNMYIQWRILYFCMVAENSTLQQSLYQRYGTPNSGVCRVTDAVVHRRPRLPNCCREHPQQNVLTPHQRIHQEPCEERAPPSSDWNRTLHPTESTAKHRLWLSQRIWYKTYTREAIIPMGARLRLTYR